MCFSLFLDEIFLEKLIVEIDIVYYYCCFVVVGIHYKIIGSTTKIF